MMNLFKVTKCQVENESIAKKINLEGDRLNKVAKATIYDGNFEVVQMTLFKFADHLSTMESNECIILGMPKYINAGSITTKDNVNDYDSKVICRTKNNFKWNEDYQLCCIDYDGSKHGDLTPNEVIKHIDSVLSGFTDVSKVIKSSSSANIYNDKDELLSKDNGFHIYFLVNRPDKIEEIFKGNLSCLSVKLQIAGFGWIKNSKPKDRKTTAVRQMERTIYDNVIFSPERIIFEAPPILEKGLIKKQSDAFVIEGTTDYLDLSGIAPLTVDEINLYKQLVQLAKNDNENDPYIVESKGIFKAHVRERVHGGQYKNNKEYDMLNENQIFEKEQAASQEAMLPHDHIIELDSGESVTVGEILKNPKQYHQQCCKDPHEPDYGSSTIAKIFSDQNVPIIRSHAHGGINYRPKTAKTKNDEPNYHSKEYVLDHFYLVNYDKKDEIYHINGNTIDKYCVLSFKHTFAGYKVEVTDGTNQKLIDMANWWLGNINKKLIRGEGFAPDKPLLYEKHGKLLLNDYVPEILHYGFDDLSTEKCAEYAFPQVSHIKTMIHNEREADILIQWFAYLVQHPNERPMFAPLISSEIRGVGKDMMTDIFCSLMGHKYAKKSTIGDLSNESSWGDVFYQTKLITVSECGSTSDRYTIGNTIKDAITTVNKTLNMKGGKVLPSRVYAGIIFFSNSISPFRLDSGDRRFFVTRCDWSKEIADEYKREGYFTNLASFYEDANHLWGLYQYLLNIPIEVNMKGDAPMTSTKEIMMNSEHNDVEQFFIDLKNHPCKYFTSKMIDDLYEQYYGLGTTVLNKQYAYHKKQLLDIKSKKLKYEGYSYRVKTFSMMYADKDNDFIRQNINKNQGITTKSLHLNDTYNEYDNDDVKEDGAIFSDLF